MRGGTIKSNGFQLLVSHWDPYKRGVPHKLKLKVSASLINPPVSCWNSQAVAAIISSFGLPHGASKHCLNWQDLTSFDLDFFCEEIEDVPDSVNVSVGSFSYNVKIKINCF